MRSWKQHPKSRKEYDDSDHSKGYAYMLHACSAPHNRILENAGIDLGINLGAKDHLGIDARTGELVDLVKEGIIDPAYVTIQAVINGTSAATALLSSKASLIIDESN